MELGPYLILASLEGAVPAAVLALTAVGLSLVFGVIRAFFEGSLASTAR